MKRKSIFIVSAIALLFVFVVGTLLYQSERGERSRAAAGGNQVLLARFHSPSLGKPDAKVHIVEFLDPACETCREFYPFVKTMMAANPDKIRLSVRHVAFHNGSEFVVRALEAARKQGKYWQTLEALLASQPNWAINHTARPELVLARLDGLGLDLERLKSDMNDPEIARVIEQDRADAMALKVRKTPEFFVNGRQMPTFGYEQLKRLVDEELASHYR
jgi:protein-disulfide isomerase